MRTNNCKCPGSKGEELIDEILNDLELEYEREYWFEDCKYKRCLFFDFAIFQKDVLKFLIEFQGEQHYIPVKIWGGKRHLKFIKMKDKIKSDYCKENNIPLLTIPYYEYNDLEQIIHKYILFVLD